MGQTGGGGTGAPAKFAITLNDSNGNKTWSLDTWPNNLYPDKTVEPFFSNDTLYFLAFPATGTTLEKSKASLIKISISQGVVTSSSNLELPTVSLMPPDTNLGYTPPGLPQAQYPEPDIFSAHASAGSGLIQDASRTWQSSMLGWVEFGGSVVPWLIGSAVLPCYHSDLSPFWSKTSSGSIYDYYTVLGGTGKYGNLILIRCHITMGTYSAPGSPLYFFANGDPNNPPGVPQCPISSENLGSFWPLPSPTSFDSSAAVDEIISQINAGTTYSTVINSRTFFIECYDPQGNVVWSETIRGNGVNSMASFVAGTFAAKDPPPTLTSIKNPYWYQQDPAWWLSHYGITSETIYLSTYGDKVFNSHRFVTIQLIVVDETYATDHYVDPSQSGNLLSFAAYNLIGYGIEDYNYPYFGTDLPGANGSSNGYLGPTHTVRNYYSNHANVTDRASYLNGLYPGASFIIPVDISTIRGGYQQSVHVIALSLSPTSTNIGLTLEPIPDIKPGQFMCNGYMMWITMSEKILAYKVSDGTLMWTISLIVSVDGNGTQSIIPSHCTDSHSYWFQASAVSTFLLSIDSLGNIESHKDIPNSPYSPVPVSADLSNEPFSSASTSVLACGQDLKHIHYIS